MNDGLRRLLYALNAVINLHAEIQRLPRLWRKNLTGQIDPDCPTSRERGGAC